MLSTSLLYNAQKMNFSIKDFFSKCDQIRRKLWWCLIFLCKYSEYWNLIFSWNRWLHFHIDNDYENKGYIFYRQYFLIFCYLSLYSFFISNQGQVSTLIVASIFQVFGTRNCLMVTQQSDQVTFVCEEYNTNQDSKLIFMISVFKISQ